MKKSVFILCMLIILISFISVFAKPVRVYKVDKEVYDSLENQEKIGVMIKLKDNSGINRVSIKSSNQIREDKYKNECENKCRISMWI